MLYLIGLGLSPKQITMEALHAIQICEAVYLENYTSAYSSGSVSELEQMIGKKVTVLDRHGIEEDSSFLVEKAKHGAIGILIFGNPLTATTHIGLLQECVDQNVNYRVLPGISVFNYRGMSGLDEYRFGRTTTFVFPEEGYEPLSTFDMIVQNKNAGLHTHCLFDLHPEKKRFMTVPEAIGFLERAGDARQVRTEMWTMVGLAGLGNEKQLIFGGHSKEVIKKEWTVFPQSLIVCGDLTPYEKEALQKLSEKTKR